MEFQDRTAYKEVLWWFERKIGGFLHFGSKRYFLIHRCKQNFQNKGRETGVVASSGIAEVVFAFFFGRLPQQSEARKSGYPE